MTDTSSAPFSGARLSIGHRNRQAKKTHPAAVAKRGQKGRQWRGTRGALCGDAGLPHKKYAEPDAMARLALNLAFYTGDPYPDLVHLGQRAEESGFDWLMVPEGIEANDAMLCCYILATATSRVRIATNVANIYLREPSLCAVAAATIQQASQGRFILGIGPSHRPVLQGLGIEMGNARDHLRKYTIGLRRSFSGERAKSLGIRFPHPAEPVPIYFGALTLETVRMAGEMADGLLLVHCTAQRLSQVIGAARDSARSHGRRPD